MTDSVTEEKSLYSDVGGWLCLDFVNTGSKYHSHSPVVDYIESYNDVVAWARQASLISAEQELLSGLPSRIKRARYLCATK